MTDYRSLPFRYRSIHKRENVLPFCVIAERMEIADLIQAARPVDRIQIMGVAGRQLGSLEITSAQVTILICIPGPRLEQVESQQAPVGARHLLCPPKKGHEKEQN